MTDTAPERSRPALPLSQLITLSIYWLGIQTIWAGLDGLVIPQWLIDLDRGSAGTLQAIVATAGAIAPILIQPTVGMISDYTVTRWGRRKPYILAGTVLDVVFLVGVAFANDFVILVAFYFLLQLSSNFAQGPFQGYVPDLVPARQVGTASGLMGTMLVAGTILGTGLAFAGNIIDNVPLMTVSFGVVELVTMVVLVATVHEGTEAPHRTQSWPRVALSAWGTDILRQRNVLWLLLVRLLFLGAYNVVRIVAGYFERSHDMTRDDASAIFFAGTAIVGVATLLAALPGARLSDRFGRRPMIWVAALVAGIGLLGVAVAPSPAVAVASFVPFGIGMGIFLSVDWALMADTIPKETTGRYMGILNAGTAMAGPVFLIVAGPVQDVVARTGGDPLGPRAGVAVGVLCLAGAALALTRVDPRRRDAGRTEAEAPVTPSPAPAA